MLLRLVTVKEVFGNVGQRDLTCHSDLFAVLKANRRVCTVGVIEYDGYASLGDTCLPPLVDQVLLVLSTHLQ